MSILYDKLSQLRDENRSVQKGKYEQEAFKEVATQLLTIAFKNDLHPDKLPECFTIRNVMLNQNQLESIFKRIGMNVIVKLAKNDTMFTSSFDVTQREETQG